MFRSFNDPYHLYSWISKTVKLQLLKELTAYSHDIEKIRDAASKIYNNIKPPCRRSEKKSINDLINTSKRAVCLKIMNDKNLFSSYEDIITWKAMLESVYTQLSAINKDIDQIINDLYVTSKSLKLE